MNRLVVTGARLRGWVGAAAASLDGDRFYILPLDVTVDAYCDVHQDSLAALNEPSVVDVAPFANNIRDRVASFATSLMFRYPRARIWNGRCLLSTLRCQGTSLWWYTEMSEKSALRGPFLGQLYSVAMVLEVLRRTPGIDEIWLDLEDRDLSGAFWNEVLGIPTKDCHDGSLRPGLKKRISRRLVPSLISRTLKLAFDQFVLIVATRASRIGRVESSDADVLLYSRYPAVWDDAFSGRARDRMLGRLPKELAKRVSTSFMVWLDLSPLTFLRKVRAIRRDLCRCRSAAVQREIGIGEVGGILGLGRFLQLLTADRDLKWMRIGFGGVDVSGLIRREFRRSICSPELGKYQLVAAGLRRFVRRARPLVVLHTMEFQPVEKAIWFGTRGYANRIGFQHSTVGRYITSYLFASGEVGHILAHQQNPIEMPLPDLLLTSGAYAREVLTRQGFPENRVVDCGAVRYDHLASERLRDRASSRRGLSLPIEGVVVLVTLPLITEEEAGRFVATAVEACQGIPNAVIVVRRHPLAPIREEALTAFAGAVDLRVVGSESGLYDAIRAADVVVVAASTTALEAAILGVPVVIWDNPTVFGQQPVADFETIGFPAKSVTELRAAVQCALVDPEATGRLLRRARTEVDRVFSRLDGSAASHCADIVLDAAERRRKSRID